MAYLKKELLRLMQISDNTYLPTTWNTFVDKEQVKHNLLIKTKEKIYCTNCGHEFISDKKVKLNDTLKCASCQNKYIVKSNRLKNYKFSRDLLLLSKIEDKFIIRMFKLESCFENDSNKFKHDISEYARVIDGTLLYNNRTFVNSGGYLSIRHYQKIKKWRTCNNYYRQNAVGKVYSDNLEEMLYDSKFKYCDLTTLAIKTEYLDIEDILENECYTQTLELLIKLKLYNLVNDIYKFNIKGSFIQRFGVGKEYLKFMQKNNINSKELEILSIYKEKDIRTIRLLSIYSVPELKILSKYINLRKMLKYKLDSHNLRLYIDYLKFAETLGYDIKDRKYLFPEDIKAAHDNFEKQVKIKNRTDIDNKIKNRYMQLKKFTYFDKDFIINPASSMIFMEEESKQQNNCVRTYAEDYSNMECDIYIMRLINKQEESLVTVEVKNNKVVQARSKNNQQPSKEQWKFLRNWEEQIVRKKECRNGRKVKRNVI